MVKPEFILILNEMKERIPVAAGFSLRCLFRSQANRGTGSQPMTRLPPEPLFLCVDSGTGFQPVTGFFCGISGTGVSPVRTAL